ncbi:uncharacterized protein LOC143695508 [Agelaius phoeniceus]|uniref:uncharacterized protein LOC143695508 n=1 Tax=Agelaius phoeniceus TaxID=39638 RepID=UPI004055020C
MADSGESEGRRTDSPSDDFGIANGSRYTLGRLGFMMSHYGTEKRSGGRAAPASGALQAAVPGGGRRAEGMASPGRHPWGLCWSLSALAAREVSVNEAALSLLQATDSGGRRSSTAVLKNRCAGEVPDEEKPHDRLCSLQGKDYPPPAKRLTEYVCTLPPLLPLPQNHYNVKAERTLFTSCNL